MNTREIKAEIKSLAPSIHANKASYKESQRKGKREDQRKIGSELYTKSRRCRHLLIAYGLMRGLEYGRIEHPREGNEPDWAVVEEIRNVSTTA